MAELKLPFVFTPGSKEFPADQVQTNFDFIRQLVQDLNDRVDSFENLEVTNIFENTGKILTTSTNQVLSANQVRFQAKTEFGGETGVEFTGSNTMIFEDEDFDIGSGYNTSTGTYTVPTDGKYFFTSAYPVQYGGTSPTSYLQIVIGAASGGVNFIQGSFESLAAGDIKTLVAVGVMSLSATDTVTVTISTASAGGNWVQPVGLFAPLGVARVRPGIFAGCLLG